MKKIFLLSFLFIVFSNIQAQFKHSVGASLFMAKADGGDNTSSYGVTYYPKYHVGTFSFGIPISLGLSGSTNSRTGASEGSSFTFHLPIMVDFNFGSEKPDLEDESFGGYVGIGYSMFTTSYVGAYTFGTLKLNAPMAHVGVNLKIAERVYNIGGSYSMGKGNYNENSSVIAVRLTTKL